ncbi:DUF6711 family protein [Lacrimispora sp.]|nr:DUF6711 family protein [Lacrimispora sp.]
MNYALKSYKCTPDQIIDLALYRDGDGVLHRNALHTLLPLWSFPPHIYG